LKILKKQKTKEVESHQNLLNILKHEKDLKYIAFQNLDLRSMEDQLLEVQISHCIFLGCDMSDELRHKLLRDHNLIFPKLDVPYNPYRAELYTVGDLYQNYDPAIPESYEDTQDYKIYHYFTKKGRYYPDSIFETLAQKLHDHSITDALMDILEQIDERKIIGMMGGHGLRRDSSDYRKVAVLSKNLIEKGYFLLSGGGPGAMEATHLGAWMAGRAEGELSNAIRILSEAPHYTHALWLSKVFEVINQFPKKNKRITDIGIPTWLYGHEQASPFASRIAKYFENSVREEGLLGLAFGGVVYTPGSAGTIQEIFQDATQNHYKSYDLVSPMIFLNQQYWTEEKPVYPLVYKLAEGKDYQRWLGIYDEPEQILDHISRFNQSVNS